jgi:hypothetical protein
MTETIQTPIASRRLALMDEPARSLVVTIGTPSPDPEPGTWACEFQIEGIPDDRIRRGYGVDSLQALQSAIQGVKATIAESGLVASWNSEPGDIGIPATIPTYEGSGFAQRIELMIEREVVDFALANPPKRT